MKQRFRLFRRGRRGIFYCHDGLTGRQESLGTNRRGEANALLAARNEADRQPVLNRKLAHAYLSATDPEAARRTWQDAMERLLALKEGVNAERWGRAVSDQALDLIRQMPLLDTRPEHLLQVLQAGGSSTNVYLRRIHNFCVDMDWLPRPVLPKRQWPAVRFRPKRAITLEEHEAILLAEHNPERRAFYELAWHLGAAQSDLAALTAKCIDWTNRVIRFNRHKTRSICVLRFSNTIARLLRQLPSQGLLFPNFHALGANHRATEFARVCRRARITGVTLHSYRYAWAQRAKACGYPERFAQVALGHNSRAVHEAYAKGSIPLCPALDEYEKEFSEKVVTLDDRAVNR